MSRYVLKTNRSDWPPEIPVKDGKFLYDLDVIEDELPSEWEQWLKDRRDAVLLRQKNSGATKKQLSQAEARPFGLNRDCIPPSMELIEV